MCMTQCHDCGTLVDTDDEPEAYVEVGPMKRNPDYICLCRLCREEREEEAERDAGEEAAYFTAGALQ